MYTTSYRVSGLMKSMLMVKIDRERQSTTIKQHSFPLLSNEAWKRKTSFGITSGLVNKCLHFQFEVRRRIRDTDRPYGLRTL